MIAFPLESLHDIARNILIAASLVALAVPALIVWAKR